mmetsp:Transcript_22437/g.40480  ORF Transcript_22437/g.40480 Transcript_22437/m.40480 type:complete len:119 (+) Transcript_22437:67-423(+)
MGRLTWTQLMTLEQEAVSRRVPKNIPGLIPIERAANSQSIFGTTVGFERNGAKSLLNHRFMFRLACVAWLGASLFQMWRPAIWGYTELVEHHNYNFDNIVYDKVSTRNAPYHATGTFP